MEGRGGCKCNMALIVKNFYSFSIKATPNAPAVMNYCYFDLCYLHDQ